MIKTRKMLFAPGLATKGRSERLVRKVLTQLEARGIPLELEVIGYPSHYTTNQGTISHYGLDVQEVARTLNLHQKENPLFVGVCYGAYLGTRTQALPEKTILIEPYTGSSSLIQPYRIMARVIAKMPPWLQKISRLPVTHQGKIERWIDLSELARFTQQETTLPSQCLLIDSGHHHFFKPLQKPSVRYTLEELQREDPRTLIDAFEKYLKT